MQTYHKGCYGCTASITDKRDGTAQLIVKLGNGKKMHDKVHKNRNAALSAWYRMGA